ncbi:SH3 domain-containing protein [Celeribacter sp.]|uniref:SH3 domain-containing protein n=1 Tax=Celeribacter sp. TaxID=1890673 RepID=UPI003A942560
MRQAHSPNADYHTPRIARMLAWCAVLAIAVILSAQPTLAQTEPSTSTDATTTADAPAATTESASRPRGSVTNLPIPRFVSLKANEANLRRGPSLSHRIDWVLKRRGYPLEVIAEYGHWRRVRDIDDATGWIHYTLISGVRTALVSAEMVDLHRRPLQTSAVVAQAEKGTVLRLLECERAWCRASAGGYKGWVAKTGIWGVYPAETLE